MSGLVDIPTVVNAVLSSSEVDSDTIEYICGMLAEDMTVDTREAVDALIAGADEDGGEELSRALWGRLLGEGGAGEDEEDEDGHDGVGDVTKLLTNKVRMAEEDSQYSGNGGIVPLTSEEETAASRGFSVAAFFANQIGVRTEAAISEKKRRKLAQKKLREEQERREREKEIEHQMAMAAAGGSEEGGDGSCYDGADFEAEDNAADVHLTNFNLPNKKGSGQDLLSNVNLTLARGRRYGLVGRNGCGKTTLMEMLAGREIQGIPRNTSLLLVKQEIMGGSMTALETVLASDSRRAALQKFVAKCEAEEGGGNAEALARAYSRLAMMEEMSGAPEPRARKVLAGLGFGDSKADSPTSKLSGGWRMRVSLACALFASPDLLLLDEPTNHLDLEAVLWLERYLNREFKGTLLIVSHDRHFLNAVVTDVLHFHRNELSSYKGDIVMFESVRDEKKKNQQRLREEQEAQRKHMQTYIDKHAMQGENGPKAARQRKSRMKKMERLGMQQASQGRGKYKISYEGAVEEVEAVVEDEEVTLDFPDPGDFDGNIVELDRVRFGYEGGETLFSDVDLTIDNKSRVAFLGRNGSGKSTLIKLIVGAMGCGSGKVKIDGRAKIEYLAQHQLEQLDPYSTPLETMKERYPGDGGIAHDQALRKYLAKFGLGGETLPNQKVHTMSGGQKCRLCLAGAMYREPHLLILDEPTNHLDLETTEALIEAIKLFKGGVMLVSHDQHLLTSCCKTLYVVGEGKVERLAGGGMDGSEFMQYKKDVIAGRR